MTYDANGNLTSVTSGTKRVKTYTYDLKDQLLTATQGSGEKASTSSYTYDSVGMSLRSRMAMARSQDTVMTSFPI